MKNFYFKNRFFIKRYLTIIFYIILLFVNTISIYAVDVSNLKPPYLLKKLLKDVYDRNISTYGRYYGNTTLNGIRYEHYDIEHNQTLKKKYDEYVAKNGDYCKEFYDDLFAWKNIEVIEPIVYDTLDYNDKRLKDAMGDCWYIDMNTTIRQEQRGRGFTLYEYNDKLLYIMTYKHFDDNVYDLTLFNMSYILDKEECANIKNSINLTTKGELKRNLENFGNILYGNYYTPIIYKDSFYLLSVYKSYDNFYKLNTISFRINEYINHRLQYPTCNIYYIKNPNLTKE